MSTLASLHKFNCLVEGDCPLFVDTSGWIDSFFVLADYYNIFVTAAIYAISLYHYELYFFLLSLSMTFDWLVNWILRISVRMSSRFPNCGETYEMPSFASQHAACLVTMVFTFFILWGHNKMRIHRILMINLGFFIVLLARLYIGTNRVSELLIGGIIGAIEGVVIQVLIYLYIMPMAVAFLRESHLDRLLGISNKLCYKRT
jgi:hypothetical protein